MPVHRLPLLVAIAVASATVVPAWAQQRGQQGGPPQGPGRAFPLPPPSWEPSLRGSGDALADAVRRIERATGGKVLSAETMQWDGREVIRIKVIDERGRVRVFTDEAAVTEGAARDPRRPGAPSTRGHDD